MNLEMNNKNSMNKTNRSHPIRIPSPAPSEPVLASYYPSHTAREVSVPNDNPLLDTIQNENIGIGATNTIDIYLCIEDEHKKENETASDDHSSEHSSIQSDTTQRHNKYMFTNKSQNQFYFAPYNKTQDTNWHIFEYNNIFLTETSFLSDIFANVIQPLIHSFKNNQSGCLALYSPDKTAWNDRLQLFDIVHQVLLQLNIDQLKCKISAYEVNDDDAYDLLPIKASYSTAIQYHTSSHLLQFSRSKKNRAPLKLSLNRSLHYVFQNINKIGIKSIEMGLQYFERSHNLFKSSKSSHYVYSITTEEGHELRIVQLCTADPMRNQALLNTRQCVKVLKRNKRTHAHTNVPYRRHIFTKLFQEFIDGTSPFSFLFYLPPIHTHKVQTTLYLDRILSLLNYSCKSKQVSTIAPLSQTPSSFASTVFTPQNEAHSLSNHNPSALKESFLQSAESTNFNMKTLLNRAYDELELSRQQNEKLLSHKNETIQQLSKQVDSVRSDCQKETEGLRNEIKILKEEKQSEEHKSRQYRKQVHVLHNEIKVINQSTGQIKHFLSQITKLLKIDLDKAQSLSWKDILHKVSQQNTQLDEAKKKIESLEKRLHEKETSDHADTKQSQRTIQDQNKEIEAWKRKIKEQAQQNELLRAQMDEMNETHDLKVSDMSQNHGKELKELHLVLDQLSEEFTSLKSSQQSSPRKNDDKNKACIDSLKSEIVHLEFQSVVHQQLTYKVQQIHDKLQRKFTKQKDAYKAELNALHEEIETKANIQQRYDEMSALYQQTCQSLKETNVKYDTLNQAMSEANAATKIKEEEIEAITASYKALLNEISPLQEQYRTLKAEHESTQTEHTSLHAKIKDYKRTQKQLTTQYILAKFQCGVHRQLNTSLKQQIADYKSGSKRLKEYKKSMQMKNETYDKLRGEYLELQREFDAHRSNGNDLKSLTEDKENLRVVNQRLQQQTNVYRFQSAAHQKIAQSAKYQKNKLKSQVIELLEQHAPNDTIKGILKDNTAAYHQKVHAAPLHTHVLPSFDDIETPKSIQTQQSNEQNANLKKQIHELQDSIQSLKRERVHRNKRQQMKLKQERNKWLYKVIDLKKELCAIMQVVQSSTKYVYQETKCEVRRVMQEYDGKHQVVLVQVENENSKLKVAVQKLELTNDALQQQLRDTNHQIDTLRNDVQCKEEMMEGMKENTRLQYKELQRKHDIMVQQCLSMSKVNEAMQIENNALIDDSIVSHDKYQSLEHQYRALCQHLFKRILISSGYKYKCKQLHKDRDNAQTNLTVEQLKMLQLNDEVQELKQMNQVFQSNRTGLMLETMEAKDTIRQLLQENNALKTSMLSKQINHMKHAQWKKKKKRIQTDIQYCNDPIHEQTIATLTRKFSMMCLKMDKVQMESLDYVQKAVALRDDNIKLKKENRRHRREIRYLESELDEVRSKPIDIDKAVVSSVAVKTIKTRMDECCIQMTDAQMNAIHSTDRRVQEMNQRLNACVNKVIQTANSHREKEKYIKDIMTQMSDVSHDIINGMKQRLDEKCTLFDMRCDGVSRNIQWIKHALDTKQSEEKQLQLEKRQTIEKHLYDVQFETKVTVKTFKNEMTHNIKHLMQCYKQQYEETQSTVSKTFALAMQRLNRSLKEKNAIIDELNGIVSAKSNELDQMMNKSMDQYNLNRNDYNELKGVHDRLKSEIAQQKQFITELNQKLDARKRVECQYNELQLVYRELEKKTAQQNELIHDMSTDKHKLNEELDALKHVESQYTELQKNAAQQKELIHDMSIDKNKLNDEIDALKEIECKYHALINELEAFKQKESQYNEERCVNDKLQNKMIELQDTIHKMTDEIDALKQIELRYNEMKSVKEQLHNEILGQHASIEQITQRNDTMKEEIVQIKSEYDAQQSVIATQTSQFEEAKETIELLQNRIRQKDASCQEDTKVYREQMAQSQRMIEDRNKEIEALTNRIQEQSKQMDDINETHDVQVSDMSKNHEKEVRELHIVLDQLSMNKDTMNQEMEKLKQTELKYEALESANAQLQSGMAQQKETYDAIQCTKDELQRELCEQKQAIKELRNQKENTVEAMEELKRQNKALKTDITQKDCDLQTSQHERDELKNKIRDLEVSLNDCESNEEINRTKAEKQEKEWMELTNELKKTQKQRNKYYNDKKVLQQEMQLVSKQLDELNESKTHLMTQLEQLMQFHSNTAQLKDKMKQYAQMTACNQQRIQHLELMKNALEKDNSTQLAEMERVYGENESLKQEMVTCDAQITKLKHCIVTKFNHLDDAYNRKVNRMRHLEEELAFKQQIINELKENMRARNNHSEVQRNEMKHQHAVSTDRIRDLEYGESVAKQRIQCLQRNVNEITSKHEAEKSAIECKLQTLTIVIVNKLNSVTHILRSKDININELSSLLTVRNEELHRMKHEMIHRSLEYEDENEMLNKYKCKLDAEVSELNRNLNALHSKHRVVKQSMDKSNKMNQTLQCRLTEAQNESFHLHKQLTLTRHENEQIHRHRDHIKEKCDELESSLKRYKDRFKSAVKECVILRKKSTVLQQLIRCAGNEIGELQFDKKSGNMREKMLSDLIATDEEEEALCDKVRTVVSVMDDENNNCNYNDSMMMRMMKQRIDDLKCECNHYRRMLRLNDESNMDLKQQTAFYTHQILENWQKIFDKLMSMINIKSYTIEIMQKTVSDILSVTDGDLQRENAMLTQNVAEMKQDVRKLEAKHRKEKIELQGLLDREVKLAHSQRDCMERELNVYKSKLQTFYKKYHRSTEHIEHQKLASFMDNMRHEMTQISQENTTMATVTNSLREIVREHQDKTQQFEVQNEAMYDDMRGLCQYMQDISGETILSEDEENLYNANNVSEMVSVVKQRALSISSSRSSLHQEEPTAAAAAASAAVATAATHSNDDDNEYTIIHHNEYTPSLKAQETKKNKNKKKDKKKKEAKVNECPICEQEFNAMVWRYKCFACDKHHCSLCAPIRQYYEKKNKRKCRVCHQCYHPPKQSINSMNDMELP